MTVQLLTDYHLEYLARPSLQLSKCYIVENHMSRLNRFPRHA